MGDNLRGGNGFALDLCEMDFFFVCVEQPNLHRRGDTDFYMEDPGSDPLHSKTLYSPNFNS